MKITRRILLLGGLILFVFGGVKLWFPPKQVQAAVSTDPNFKVAFIGDSGGGSGFQNVLNLIKNEGANMVIHQGDFDYSAGPQKWMDMVNNTLGSSFPYLGSDGNHDEWDADGYATFFKNRLITMGITPPSGSLSPSYSAVHKGLKVVFSKENGDPTHINNELSGDDHIWKICSWHKNMRAMQVGGKGNGQGWPDYETCRQYGAIIVTGHEHSYHRTKTLISTENQTVDTSQHPLVGGVPSNPNSVLVAPGKTIVHVTGTGGLSIRNQERCLPYDYPYGGGPECNYIWAKIYTSNQQAKAGALFITFNYNGDPNKAHAYFKNINGAVIDNYEITASGVPVTPTPTPTSTPSPTPTSTPTPTPTPTPPSGNVLEIRVNSNSDDAEEKTSGNTYLGSSDLELVYDGSNQTVGMRFNGLNLVRGTTITNAYVQFQVDESTSETTSLSIQGEAVANASTFTTATGNISSRSRTTASVSWSPPSWTSVGEAGLNQRTPNLAAVIQEILSHPDWQIGNSLVIIITGTGKRTAESHNGVASAAPLLHIEFDDSGSTPTPLPCAGSGDVDCDSDVDINDILTVLQNWLSPSPDTERADVNNDGKVNGIDFGHLIIQYF